jgi:hypothetical protein
MAQVRTRGRTRAGATTVTRPRPAAQGRPHHSIATTVDERWPVLRLQRSAGNAAVTALVHGHAVQRRTEPGWGSSVGGVTEHAPGPSSTGPGPAGTTAPATAVRPISDAQPAGVAAHLPSAEELANIPAAADAPALLAENQRLYAAREARRRAFDAERRRGGRPDPATREFTADEQARVDVLNLQLRARMKADEDETLRLAGFTQGVAAWFAEVKDYSFLGKTVTVHRLLAERLARAEAQLSGVTPPPGGWFRSTSSLRGLGQSLHGFGMAIDLDGGRNPYLVNPDARGASAVEPTARSRAIADIVDRAGLLVRGLTAAEADLQSRPVNADRDARALDSYDKLRAASDAVKRYFELDQATHRPALEAFVRALAGKDARTADEWVNTIRADRTTLREQAQAKNWTDPESGFLSLDRRLVAAMTSSAGGGLTWLGDDTIGSGRDIMHFDMRGPGPIRAIVKSASGRGPVSLGRG